LVRHVLFEHLQRDRELGSFWFGDQQMDVLRHDHVSRDVEAVPVSRALKRLFKDVAGSGRAQKRRSPIAAKS